MSRAHLFGPSGIVRDSNGTVHPGRVGIWAGSGSAAVRGDNFKVRSLNADLALDGRFADDIGSCSISGGAYVMNSSGDTRQSVLSGVRVGGAYVVQVDQTWRTGLPAGLIVNYQDPENFGVIMLEPGALGGQAKVTYAEFKNGGKRGRREAIAVR